MTKYRLIRRDSDKPFAIELLEKKYWLAGPKLWRVANMFDFNKARNVKGPGKYAPLVFNSQTEAESVYDYIIKYQKLDDSCIDIILREYSKYPILIEILRENSI